MAAAEQVGGWGTAAGKPGSVEHGVVDGGTQVCENLLLLLFFSRGFSAVFHASAFHQLFFVEDFPVVRVVCASWACVSVLTARVLPSVRMYLSRVS